MKLLNFVNLHSPDLIFVTETWLYPKIEDSEVFPLKCSYSINAGRDRSGGEHGGVFIAGWRDFKFNYSELILKNDQTLKIGHSNNFVVAISEVLKCFNWFTSRYRDRLIGLNRTF